MTSFSGDLPSPLAGSGASASFAGMVERHRADMRAIVRSKLRLLRADASPLQDLDRPLDALYEWLSHLSEDAVTTVAQQPAPGAVIDLARIQNRYRAGVATAATRAPARF